VEKAVLLQADVDEGGLQAGEDVVDAALVDVAHDRPVAPALEVQLGDLVFAGGGGLTAPPCCARGCLARSGGTARLQERHSRLSAIDADQYLLLQFSSVL
jgi:hypothetical protein